MFNNTGIINSTQKLHTLQIDNKNIFIQEIITMLLTKETVLKLNKPAR